MVHRRLRGGGGGTCVLWWVSVVLRGLLLGSMGSGACRLSSRGAGLVALWHVGSWFPDQGSNLIPSIGRRIPTTGTPGKSLQSGHCCMVVLYLPNRQSSLVAQTEKSLPARQEARVWSLGWKDPLEKGMATHSSILAWKFPWMGEPGGPQSMELQRVRHDWATNTHTPPYIPPPTHTHSPPPSWLVIYPRVCWLSL